MDATTLIALVAVGGAVLYWRLYPNHARFLAPIALLSAWVSLFCTYYPCTSTAWSIRFGHPFGQDQPNVGFYVEAARILLLIMMSVRLLTHLFRAEFTGLFRHWKSLLWWIARGSVATIAILVATGVTQYHLSLDRDSGPRLLYADLEDPNSSNLQGAPHYDWIHKWDLAKARMNTVNINREFQAPYRWYLVQSLVDYLLIRVPLFSAVALAVIFDFSLSRRSLARYASVIRDASRIDQLEQLFGEFRIYCLEGGRRYQDLLMWVSLAFLYEYLIGWRVMQTVSFGYLVLSIALIGAGTVFLLYVFLFYSDGYAKFRRRRFEVKGEPDLKWEDENQPHAFLWRFVSSGATGVTLVSMFGPLIMELFRANAGR